MSDMKLMQVQVDGSGVDSGEVNYTIFTANLDKMFSSPHLKSRVASKDDIMGMLDALKRKTQDYYDGSLTADPPTKP